MGRERWSECRSEGVSEQEGEGVREIGEGVRE